MRGEDARLEAREHECVDVRMLDAGPERGERGVQVIAHGRREHDVDALFFGEVLEDAEAAAGDVRLEEQRAVLPAREAEAPDVTSSSSVGFVPTCSFFLRKWCSAKNL